MVSAWNTNGQAVYNALNHQLTGADNLVRQKYPTTGYYNFTTSKTYTSAGTFTPISFVWTFPENYPPNEVRLGVLQPTNSTVIKTPVSLSWSYNGQNSQISVNYIAGLAANTNYNLTLIVE